MVFFFKDQMNERLEKLLLGFASGVMIAASIWSLIIPSLEMAEGQMTWIPAAVGFLGGIFFLLLLDTLIPHLHLNTDQPEGLPSSLKNSTKMVLAITLHNIPEGMAVGVVFAGMLSQEGIVTLTEWAVPYGQLAAYEDCFKRFRDETQWIGYIDLDEFVCLRRETSLGRWLASFRKYPCVHVYWKMFGTSGVLEHDPQVPVIEQYTACWPLQANVGKSFVNTDFEIVSFNCHLFYAETTLLGHKVSLLPVNEFKRFIHHWKARAPRGAKSEAQINHYYNRSYAQYLYKTLRRGDACSAGSQKGREDKERFAREENRNTARDYAIQRFLLQLKLRLNDNPAIKAGTSV